MLLSSPCIVTSSPSLESSLLLLLCLPIRLSKYFYSLSTAKVNKSLFGLTLSIAEPCFSLNLRDFLNCDRFGVLISC